VAKGFYKEFFGFGMSQSNGHMAGYEPDFLHQNFVCMPHFLTNLSASAAWSQAMNDAAMEMETGGMPIQWCMATPSDLMQVQYTLS
jgi:hypothetical protein